MRMSCVTCSILRVREREREREGGRERENPLSSPSRSFSNRTIFRCLLLPSQLKIRRRGLPGCEWLRFQYNCFKSLVMFICYIYVICSEIHLMCLSFKRFQIVMRWWWLLLWNYTKMAHLWKGNSNNMSTSKRMKKSSSKSTSRREKEWKKKRKWKCKKEKERLFTICLQ